MSDSEFYIGYRSSAPPRLARFLRLVVGSLALGGLVVALTLTALQKPFDPGRFEFGVHRDYEGLVLERPVPTLVVSDSSRFLLVAPGKFGARDLVSGLHGKMIHVQGSLIHRQGEAMLELVPDSLREVQLVGDPPSLTALDLGEQTLVGEIVDSKCYLGVMKPGREKTHRACAVRCISGGIPPILRITTAQDETFHLLLVGEDGEPIHQQILEFVAEPVEISGTIRRLGDQWLLHADLASIRRLRG